MGLFSGPTISDGGEQNGSTHKDEPPLVIATPIASAPPAEAVGIDIFKVEAPVAASTATNNALPPKHLASASGRLPDKATSCPYCQTPRITTRIRTYPSFETWAIVMTLLLVFWPICWIPLVMDSCKTTDHFCPSCHENVGRVKPLQDCCTTEMG